MDYYFTNILKGKNFDQATEIVSDELKKEGFGILTEIDVKDTLKKKIDVDFKRYKILGACNPHFAHKALLAEDKVGVFLPCNIVVEENENGDIEISAFNPIVSMSAIKNPDFQIIAKQISHKLEIVIRNLGK